MATRKLKSVARYGARYGKKIRVRMLKVERDQHKKQPCPRCGLGTLKRKAAGLYACTKCQTEFAGGAYVPRTLAGTLVQRMIAQKGATSARLAAELALAREVAKGEDVQEASEAPSAEDSLDDAPKRKRAKKKKDETPSADDAEHQAEAN